MPSRKVPLITEEIYHIFNQSLDNKTAFIDKNSYLRALKTVKYYKHHQLPVRLSFFLRKPPELQKQFIKQVKAEAINRIKIHSFCLMPNHFHFLLKQEMDSGISKFMADFQNSYTRYYNTRKKRKGKLFLTQFKAVLIKSASQFNHVSRYIHLNPYSAGLIKKLSELEKYPWSSFKEFVNNNPDVCDLNLVLSNFNSPNSYKKFVLDQADYQKNLQFIKHLVLEKNQP